MVKKCVCLAAGEGVSPLPRTTGRPREMEVVEGLPALVPGAAVLGGECESAYGGGGCGDPRYATVVGAGLREVVRGGGRACAAWLSWSG